MSDTCPPPRYVTVRMGPDWYRVRDIATDTIVCDADTEARANGQRDIWNMLAMLRAGITCTLQRHRPSGEVHALRYAGDAITGISAALSRRDVAALTPAGLTALAYAPYQGAPDGTGPDGFVQWSPPIMTTNPEERS